MKRTVFKKGQTLTEIALIIGLLGLVFIGMEIYIRRGVQGKVKDLTDTLIGEKQEAYQQDTSALEINESESSLIAGSTVITSEGAGGRKTVDTDEYSTVTYTSKSGDN
ncbi:MAG: hypothetical protein WC478_05285 [Candidatus Omnitrophota bacterium]